MNIEYISIEDIRRNNIKLLGEIEIGEDNFENLKNQLIKGIPTSGETDLNISLNFVRFATKYYDENFWPTLYEKLQIQPFNSDRQTKWGKLFLNTIRRYGDYLLELPSSSRNEYVENIKFHAIVPDSYIEKYCEFLFDCYQNFFKDSIDDFSEFQESLLKLSQSIKAQLNTQGQEISSGMRNKSYTLLKSSRRVFAEIEINKLTNLFYPIFKLIDDFYEEKDITPKTRLQKFICSHLKSLECTGTNEGKKRNFKKNPYIEIEPNNKYSPLCFPKGSVLSDRIQPTDKKLIFYITIDNKEKQQKLEVEINQYFDNYIYDSFYAHIPNESIFQKIKITISTPRGETVKEYIIPKSNYRIFDSNNKLCKSMRNGTNYLITPKGMALHTVAAQLTSDTSSPYWDYHAVNNFTKDSILKIGNEESGFDTLCLNSIFNQSPQFENIFTEMKVKKGETAITAARKHPLISFSIEQNLFEQACITVNRTKKPLKEFQENLIKKEIDDLYLINLPLENILQGQYGFFNITLAIPTRNEKSLAEYAVFPKNFLSLDRNLYVQEKQAVLTIKNLNDTDTYTNTTIPLPADNATISLKSNGQTLSISIPLPTFKYGPSADKLEIKIDNDFLWYKHDLYFYVGKQAVIASIGNESTDEWKVIQEDTSCNLPNYCHRFCLDEERNNKTIKINPLGSNYPIFINRIDKLKVVPEKLALQINPKITDCPYIKINEIIGKEEAKLVVDIKNHDTDELLYEKYILQEEINQFSRLKADGNYDLYFFMREGDSLYTDIPLESLQTQNIPPLNIEKWWNLMQIETPTNRGIMRIYDIIQDTKIELIRKEAQNVYTGKLYYRNNTQKLIMYNIKITVLRQEKDFLCVSLQVQEHGTYQWIYPYLNQHHLDNRRDISQFQLSATDRAVLKLVIKE